MKIRTRLSLAALVALIPMWIGITAITVMGRSSDREKTVNLMEEYAQGIASRLASFFGDAIDMASYLAIVQSDSEIEWLGERGGGNFLLTSSCKRAQSVERPLSI